MNQRPPGYEPDELPDCSTPQHVSDTGCCRKESAYISGGDGCQEKDYFRMIFLRLQAIVAFTFLTGYDVRDFRKFVIF